MSHAKQLSIKKVVGIEEHEQAYEGNVSDYDATYALPKKIVKTVGLRILINDTNIASICWNLYFWFNLINVLLASILESINMFSMASVGTFLNLFTMMPCVGYLLVAAAKAYKIKHYRSVYENLVYELRDMWPNGRITEEEHKVISKALSRLRFVVKAYFGCNMTLGSIFTVPPFISYIKNKAGFEDELMLPFFYWLPYDPCIGNRFEITMFLQTCHCFLAAGFMLSGDLLFCTFLSHITTQFALLAVRINKLIYVPIDDQLIESYPLGMYSKLHSTNGQYGQMNDEEREKKLNAELISIIVRHRALIRLSNDVENMYSFSLLVNFLNSSIIICFCLFCCAFVEKWNGTLYKLFFITAILQIWMLCWYGQKLLDTSTGVADALYNSGWYLTSNKMKKTIFIIMHRSQKHVYVTTYGFSIISLESYSTILKTSWSYFTLLINMYKE